MAISFMGSRYGHLGKSYNSQCIQYLCGYSHLFLWVAASFSLRVVVRRSLLGDHGDDRPCATIPDLDRGAFSGGDGGICPSGARFSRLFAAD
jgi:hypothetical protein